MRGKARLSGTYTFHLKLAHSHACPATAKSHLLWQELIPSKAFLGSVARGWRQGPLPVSPCWEALSFEEARKNLTKKKPGVGWELVATPNESNEPEIVRTWSLGPHRTGKASLSKRPLLSSAGGLFPVGPDTSSGPSIHSLVVIVELLEAMFSKGMQPLLRLLYS